MSFFSLFLFAIRESVLACWNIFMMAALKSQLDNSSIWLIDLHIVVIAFSHSNCDFPGSWYDGNFSIVILGMLSIELGDYLNF